MNRTLLQNWRVDLDLQVRFPVDPHPDGKRVGAGTPDYRLSVQEYSVKGVTDCKVETSPFDGLSFSLRPFSPDPIWNVLIRKYSSQIPSPTF